MADVSSGTIGHSEASIEKLESLGWGLLSVWIGLALLTHLGWAIGFLGVGAILLCEQVAKKYFGRAMDVFWIVVGAVFVIGGMSDLSGVHVPVIPVALIFAGVVLLLSALLKKTAADPSQ